MSKKKINYDGSYEPMVRKNVYITKRQNKLLSMVKYKIGKQESTQIRDALELYFSELGL